MLTRELKKPHPHPGALLKGAHSKRAKVRLLAALHPNVTDDTLTKLLEHIITGEEPDQKITETVLQKTNLRHADALKTAETCLQRKWGDALKTLLERNPETIKNLTPDTTSFKTAYETAEQLTNLLGTIELPPKNYHQLYRTIQITLAHARTHAETKLERNQLRGLETKTRTQSARNPNAPVTLLQQLAKAADVNLHAIITTNPNYIPPRREPQKWTPTRKTVANPTAQERELNQQINQVHNQMQNYWHLTTRILKHLNLEIPQTQHRNLHQAETETQKLVQLADDLHQMENTPETERMLHFTLKQTRNALNGYAQVVNALIELAEQQGNQENRNYNEAFENVEVTLKTWHEINKISNPA